MTERLCLEGFFLDSLRIRIKQIDYWKTVPQSECYSDCYLFELYPFTVIFFPPTLFALQVVTLYRVTGWPTYGRGTVCGVNPSLQGGREQKLGPMTVWLCVLIRDRPFPIKLKEGSVAKHHAKTHANTHSKISSRENICLSLNALSEYHMEVAAWSVGT